MDRFLVLCFLRGTRGSFSPAASNALGHGPKKALIFDRVTSSKSSFLGWRPSALPFWRKSSTAWRFFSSLFNCLPPFFKTKALLTRQVKRAQQIYNSARKLAVLTSTERCTLKPRNAVINRLHSSHQRVLNLRPARVKRRKKQRGSPLGPPGCQA